VPTLPRVLRERATASPDHSAQWSLDAMSNEWRARTWRDFERRAATLANALRDRGLEPGERVGIIAPSCERWDWVQMGVLGARGVVVGLDPHDMGARLSDIALRAGVTVLFAATTELVAKFAETVRANLRLVVVFDGDATAAGNATAISLGRMLEPLIDAPGEWDRAEPDDTATILFTSGTTGEPKGIAYTHRQMCLTVAALLDAFADIREGSHLACWLPLANIFQRTVNICAIGRGAQIFYVVDPRAIMRWIARIDPPIFIGVPRFYEKLYAGIEERIATAPVWMRRAVRWSMAAGSTRAQALRRGDDPGALDGLRFAVADALVLRRIRHVMGNQLRYMISGSAPMSRSLLERFEALGFIILEGYALSENVIPIATNTPAAMRFGTVGKPMRGNEVKIAPDGEVKVRGPGVFAGYYGDASAPDSVDADGFLATGDLGEIDPDGFLTLTGRKSEIVKTSTGRRLAPVHVESVLRQASAVEHAVVFGAGRAAPIALISVAPAFVANASAGERDGGDDAGRKLLAACARLRADLRRVVQELPNWQRPEGLVVTTRSLTIEAGELTSNLKLRRPAIERTYGPYLSELDRRLASASGDCWPIAGDSDVVLCRL
jgi:long-chain acyl-CoA synthetase